MAPDVIEIEINLGGKAEGSPDPMRCGVLLLHLNHADVAPFVGDNRVKKFRVRDREE